MVDYVNHLARLHLLGDAATGQLNPAYEIDWHLWPNLAVGIIVPSLARFVSVETAARLFLFAGQSLVVSGATPNRGSRATSIVGLRRADRAVQSPFLWGLMNFSSAVASHYGQLFGFTFAKGLGLSVCITYGFVALFIAHIFALSIGLTIGCYELSQMNGYRRAARPSP